MRAEMEDFVYDGMDVSLRSYDARKLSDATGIDTGPNTLVQQQFVEDADINVIVRRFGLTRDTLMPFSPTGLYGDFTDVSDFPSAVQRIERATARFMELPPQVRERFDNDPGRLIQYAGSMSPQDFEKLFEVPAEPVVPVTPAP